MKKKSTAMAMAIVMIAAALPMSGCGSSEVTAQSIMKESAEKQQSVSSVTSDMTMNMALTMDMSAYGYTDSNVSYDMQMTTDTTKDPYASHSSGNISSSMFGQDADSSLELYLDDEDGEVMTYSNSGDGWTKYDTGITGEFAVENMMSTDIYEKVGDGSLEAELSEEAGKVGDQETYQISFQLTGDLLSEYLGNIVSSTSMTSSDAIDWSDFSADVSLDIAKDTMLPARMVIDCKDLGKAMMSAVASQVDVDVDVSEFKVTTDYTAFDSVDAIEIPDDVKEEAGEAVEISVSTSDAAEEATADETEEDQDSAITTIEPNKDGSYTLTDYEGSRTADVTLLTGTSYTYGAQDTLQSMSDDNQYCVLYQLNGSMTAEEEEDYVTDTSWYADDDQYKGVKQGKVKTVKVGDMTVSYCTLDYTYEEEGSDSYDVQNIYAWTAYDKSSTFIVQIYEYLTDGAKSEISTDMVKEAFENVKLGSSK